MVAFEDDVLHVALVTRSGEIEMEEGGCCGDEAG